MSLRRDAGSQAGHEKGDDLVAGRGGRLPRRIDQIRGDHAVRAADDLREERRRRGIGRFEGSTRGSKRDPNAAA